MNIYIGWFYCFAGKYFERNEPEKRKITTTAAYQDLIFFIFLFGGRKKQNKKLNSSAIKTHC